MYLLTLFYLRLIVQINTHNLNAPRPFIVLLQPSLASLLTFPSQSLVFFCNNSAYQFPCLCKYAWTSSSWSLFLATFILVRWFLVCRDFLCLTFIPLWHVCLYLFAEACRVFNCMHVFLFILTCMFKLFLFLYIYFVWVTSFL